MAPADPYKAPGALKSSYPIVSGLNNNGTIKIPIQQAIGMTVISLAFSRRQRIGIVMLSHPLLSLSKGGI